MSSNINAGKTFEVFDERTVAEKRRDAWLNDPNREYPTPFDLFTPFDVPQEYKPPLIMGMPTLLQDHGDCFKKQRDALEQWRTEPHRRILSYDCFCRYPDTLNPRGYVVIDFDAFWNFYLYENERNFFYEVIPEDTPCRLYFDLEFSTRTNPSIDGPFEVKEFCKLVAKLAEETYSFSEKIAEKNFLILQSMSPGKFSVHVIVHLPNQALFASNAVMKGFVDQVCKYLFENKVGLVRDDQDSNDVPICDMAVYSRNRNFRIFKSVKPKQNNPLLLASFDCFYDKGNVPDDKQILIDSWVVPENYASCRILDVDDSRKENGSGSTEFSSIGSKDAESPFPMIQEFILEINRKFKFSVSIRSWKVYPETYLSSHSGRILYQLNGCRYCFNIGREHKRNHVYWVVNVARRECYQRCFDPDCANHRSGTFKLPYYCVAELRENAKFFECEPRCVSTNFGDEDQSNPFALPRPYPAPVDDLNCYALAIENCKYGPGRLDPRYPPTLQETWKESHAEDDLIHEDSFYDPSTDTIFYK